MVRENYLVFGAPKFSDAEIDEVVDSMRTGWIGTGPKVARFERDFAEYVGAARAVALNSCTAGLHLALEVLDLQPGDEVITTPLTFVATANAIVHAGGRPVFVDVDRRTMLLDLDEVEKAITPRTRAVIPVHLAGRAVDMDRLDEIAAEHDLAVIEDAAHAIESTSRGRKVGAMSDMTCFSFYATKNIVTGEGGMVTTQRDDYADRIKILALHGMSRDAWKRFSDDGYKHYEVQEPGFKYNMMDIQAAMGIHQLARVDEFLARRDEIWARYQEAFADLPVELPAPDEEGSRHARHLYTVLVDSRRSGISRDDFMAALHRQNIGTGVHYRGVHLHPYYQRELGVHAHTFPNATLISDRTVSLPMGPSLTDTDVDDVIAAVQATLRP
jgi:dTDP-4-amino-4,6-dideoxygalactose transaminase